MTQDDSRVLGSGALGFNPGVLGFNPGVLVSRVENARETPSVYYSVYSIASYTIVHRLSFIE